MRILPLVFVCLLPTLALAQVNSGRHFHRDSRLPSTPPASAAVEASAQQGLAPLAKLRSGRPWPRHHFGRLPVAETPSTTQAVDATLKTTPSRRGFWRARR